MAESLSVKSRDSRGKREAKRMRRAGSIPAILYGHGEANRSLVVGADAMAAVVRHGSRVVELTGDVNEKALIRALQWDVYGTHVLHVDFTRVSEHERIEVKVTLEMRGQAAGAKDGGIVEQLVHELEIECEALAIPDKLELNISELQKDGQILASEVPLPPGVVLVSDGEAVVVHCVEARAEEEEGGAPGAGGEEPEIIGRKPEEEEAEE